MDWSSSSLSNVQIKNATDGDALLYSANEAAWLNSTNYFEQGELAPYCSFYSLQNSIASGTNALLPIGPFNEAWPNVIPPAMGSNGIYNGGVLGLYMINCGVTALPTAGGDQPSFLQMNYSTHLGNDYSQTPFVLGSDGKYYASITIAGQYNNIGPFAVVAGGTQSSFEYGITIFLIKAQPNPTITN